MCSDSEPYRTVSSPASTEVVRKGSRFIGHICGVESTEAAETYIDEISREYPDATHNVPAYRVRADPFREYAADAGEPPGSAGKPALGVLQHRELENVVVVITRYYGGTDLGFGGLVRAYSETVNNVVNAAGIVEQQPHDSVVITAEYDDSGTVRGILASTSIQFEAEFTEIVEFTANVPTHKYPAIKDRLLSATRGRIEIENHTRE